MFCAYPIIIHEGEENDYWAEFVDFNAFTQGDTLNELIANAAEAMVCHIEDELRKGTALPTPSDIRQINMKENEFATLVYSDIGEPRPARAPAIKAKIKQTSDALMERGKEAYGVLANN